MPGTPGVDLGNVPLTKRMGAGIVARMSKPRVWAEMARRKVQFHNDTDWDRINLWGLFNWGAVSHMIASGELVTSYKKEHVTIWVRPSKEAYEKHIKPLLDKPLDELQRLAGW